MKQGAARRWVACTEIFFDQTIYLRTRFKFKTVPFEKAQLQRELFYSSIKQGLRCAACVHPIGNHTDPPQP